MRHHLVERMRALDYSSNILGWGIDWVIAAHAYSQGDVAVVDRSVIVHHEFGRGYDSRDAQRQMAGFMQQMTSKEKITFELLRSHVRYRRSLLPKKAHPGLDVAAGGLNS